LIAVAAVSLIGLFGCSNSDEVSDDPSATPQPENVETATQVAQPTSTVSTQVSEPVQSYQKVIVVVPPGNPRLDAIAFDGGGFPAFVDSGVGNEGLFWGGDDGERMTPMLATGWEIQPDGAKVTINIRKGVPWYAPVGWEHIDFGMFTANDFADWMNLSNPTTNPESKHYLGGWWAPHYGEARAIDSHTLEIDLLQTISFELLGLSIFDCFCAGPDFVRGIEMMGSEWANKYPVRTSPFRWEACDPSIGDLTQVSGQDKPVQVGSMRSVNR
jgi:ABC-type transport system substrate-binding protein